MGMRGVYPEQIALDESGRVILSDAELDDACTAELPLAGGTINPLSCTNLSNCQNSANTSVCTNAIGACAGAGNLQSCTVVRKEG